MKSVNKELKSTIKIIEDVCETVCDDLCKYRETADNEFVCNYMKEHGGECPLDRLR